MDDVSDNPLETFSSSIAQILDAPEVSPGIVLLCGLEGHPYSQVVERLAEMTRTEEELEGMLAGRCLASLKAGVGMHSLATCFDEGLFDETARLVLYARLLEGYGRIPGASALILSALVKETDTFLRVALLRGVEARAGREALEFLGQQSNLSPALQIATDRAWAAIDSRNPSDVTYVLAVVLLCVLLGGAYFLASNLRMPPSVIERFYLRETDLCSVDLELEPCDIQSVVQGMVRFQPSRFNRFFRVSVLFEGEGELGFKERSLTILDQTAEAFVGGGTIVDGWCWCEQLEGRVLANWYFRVGEFERCQGKPVLQVGMLYRPPSSEEESPNPTIRLTFAGLIVCKDERPAVEVVASVAV